VVRLRPSTCNEALRRAYQLVSSSSTLTSPRSSSPGLCSSSPSAAIHACRLVQRYLSRNVLKLRNLETHTRSLAEKVPKVRTFLRFQKNRMHVQGTKLVSVSTNLLMLYWNIFRFLPVFIPRGQGLCATLFTVTNPVLIIQGRSKSFPVVFRPSRSSWALAASLSG
jgi:hypothetical protein